MTMGTQQRDRDAETHAEIQDLLAQGKTRAALHCARHFLEAKAAAVRRTDPARAALLDATLAGVLVTQAKALPTIQPRRPPGYQGGPPSAADLLSAYDTARSETGRRR